MKARKPDGAVKQEAGGRDAGGRERRTNGRKEHEASEERADGLGRARKRRRKQAGPNGNVGSGMEERKARTCGEYGRERKRERKGEEGKQSRRMKFRETGTEWKAGKGEDLKRKEA